MQVLVTGGAGFIGSHLAAALAAQGHQVRVLDNLSSGRRENLAGAAVELVVGDIRDWVVVETAVSGCDLVFHQAALVSVPQSIAEPRQNHQVNVDGTFHVFEAARQAGVRRVIYASSAAVYGNLPGLPKRESDPLAPISPYAAAKLMNETMAQAYTAVYGMELIGLRYMNVFGPRQDPSSPYSGVLSIFCRAAISGRGVTIFGDGAQTRDFVYVADVVQANLRAAQADWSQLGKQQVFNVGRGQQTSLNQIVVILEEIVGQPMPVQHGPERPGDIKHSIADIQAAQKSFAFDPQVSVADGLRETVAWFRQGLV